MSRLWDRFRYWLFWLVLADVHPNRDHRRNGWGRIHTTRRTYR